MLQLVFLLSTLGGLAQAGRIRQPFPSSCEVQLEPETRRDEVHIFWESGAHALRRQAEILQWDLRQADAVPELLVKLATISPLTAQRDALIAAALKLPWHTMDGWLFWRPKMVRPPTERLLICFERWQAIVAQNPAEARPPRNLVDSEKLLDQILPAPLRWNHDAYFGPVHPALQEPQLSALVKFALPYLRSVARACATEALESADILFSLEQVAAALPDEKQALEVDQQIRALKWAPTDLFGTSRRARLSQRIARSLYLAAGIDPQADLLPGTSAYAASPEGRHFVKLFQAALSRCQHAQEGGRIPQKRGEG